MKYSKLDLQERREKVLEILSGVKKIEMWASNPEYTYPDGEAKGIERTIRVSVPVLFTRVESVARSGMSRTISVYAIRESEPLNISHIIAPLAGGSYVPDLRAVRIGGCGMDMGFALICNLSYALFGNERGIKQEWM